MLRHRTPARRGRPTGERNDLDRRESRDTDPGAPDEFTTIGLGHGFWRLPDMVFFAVKSCKGKVRCFHVASTCSTRSSYRLAGF